MERGLIWLPLLALFVGLAAAGWHEHRKVEAYRRWAQDFERAKYDIRAVLGQRGDRLVWGRPSRRGPQNLQELSLRQLERIELLVDGTPVSPADPPERGSPALAFYRPGGELAAQVPFTQIALAAQWGRALQQQQHEAQAAG